MAIATKQLRRAVERRPDTPDLLTDLLLNGTASRLKDLARSATFRAGATPETLEGALDEHQFVISRSGRQLFSPGFPEEARLILLELVEETLPVPISTQRPERPGLRVP